MSETDEPTSGEPEAPAPPQREAEEAAPQPESEGTGPQPESDPAASQPEAEQPPSQPETEDAASQSDAEVAAPRAGAEEASPAPDLVTLQAAPPVAPAGWPGPRGKPRGVVFVIVVSIVTIGIYHLYWVFKAFEEMKNHTGNGIGGVLGLVVWIVFNPVDWFVMPSEVGKMYRGAGLHPPMSGWTGLWMILPIVGWFVWTIKIQHALNRYWEGKATAG